jgi:hypothetical protein
MLAILITWIAGLSIFFAFGHLFFRLLKLHEGNAYQFVDVFFLGFGFAGTLLALLSIWIALTTYVLLFLFVFSIFYLVYDSKKKRNRLLTDTFRKIMALPLIYKIAIVFFTLVLLIYSVLPPLNYDTALYHWQAMKWTESYPVVPGLANIHDRFGFNSNSLLLYSVFSFRGVLGFSTIGLNSLLLLVFFVWLVLKIRESKLIPQLALILFFSVFLRYYDVNISSPNTDLIPNIFISYLLLRAILDHRSFATAPLLFLILPVFCLTLKLSVAPFGIFSLIVFIYLIKEKQYKLCFVSTLVAGAILIPWLARNVILSGYLIFPYSAIDLFNVDWKVPAVSAEKLQAIIKAWARSQDADFDKVMSLPFAVWGKHWLLRCYEHSKMVVFILGLAAVSPLVILFTQGKKLIKNPFRIYPWAIAFLGTLFWAVTAPDVRFAFGYIAFTACAPFILIEKKIENAFLRKLPCYAGFLSLFFFTGIGLYVNWITKGDNTFLSFLCKPNTTHFLHKEASVTFTAHKLGDIVIYTPETGDQCYDHSLPCIPDFCMDCLELRGKSLKEGFRVKK